MGAILDLPTLAYKHHQTSVRRPVQGDYFSAQQDEANTVKTRLTTMLISWMYCTNPLDRLIYALTLFRVMFL